MNNFPSIRMSSEEEKEWSKLISRISVRDWWTSSVKSIPPRICFQRFGAQLREEDLAQDGTPYRGFLIRDRTEAKRAQSGFSEVENNDKYFQVTLDMRPFKRHEMDVKFVGDSHFMVIGEHKEKFEDNSECSRQFTRYYFLPKGCKPQVEECPECVLFNNGILKVTVGKSIAAEKKDPQTTTIPIEDKMGKCEESEDDSSVLPAEPPTASETTPPNDESIVDDVPKIIPIVSETGDGDSSSGGDGK